MTNAIVENKTFEEKMKERIKESIGDLIGDDDLKKLLDAALHDVFFKPSKIRVNSYDYKEGPSFLQEIVKEEMEGKVRDAVKEYINSHEDEVNKIINDVVSEGVGVAMIGAMNQLFRNQLFTFQSNIAQQLSSRGL